MTDRHYCDTEQKADCKIKGRLDLHMMMQLTLKNQTEGLTEYRQISLQMKILITMETQSKATELTDRTQSQSTTKKKQV